MQGKALTLDCTTSYVSAAASAGTAYGAGRVLDNVEFKNVGTVNIRVSIVLGGASTGNDGVSFLLLPGEAKSFAEIDLNNVWRKSVGAASTAGLQITGDEQ